jgi:hypothetical protein
MDTAYTLSSLSIQTLGIFLIVSGPIIAGIQIGISQFNEIRATQEEKAISKGFDTYDSLKEAEKAGFDTEEEKSQSISLGFTVASARNMAETANFKNLQEMRNKWEAVLQDTRKLVNDFTHQDVLNRIKESKNQADLDGIQTNLQDTFTEMTNQKKLTEEMCKLQESFIDLQFKLKREIFVSYSSTELKNNIDALTHMQSELQTILFQERPEIEKLIKEKTKWFEPWQHLLELIQETREGAEISLKVIADAIQVDEKHGEELLLLLLQDYPDLGKHYRLERTYVKGTNIGDLIDGLVHDFVVHEQSKLGKRG